MKVYSDLDEKKKKKFISESLIFMENVLVTFGKVVALDSVNFHIMPNEVVGLLGDNGAGKSTLIKSINGYNQITSGNIFYNGKHAFFKSPKDARNAGIETAYQDLALVNLMSISRNFFLGRELTKKIGPISFLRKKKMDEKAAKSLSNVGLENIREMEESVNFLSGGERQAISIGRATYFGAKLLILDEPTAALSVKETEWVLQLVSEAKNNGLAVIFISHNAYEVFGVADRFVVLQHGKNYADLKRDETDPEHLIEVIAGRK